MASEPRAPQFDWWAESVKLYRRLRAVERAAQAVLDDADKNLDDPFPIKYRAPYGALNKLRETLVTQPTIDERNRMMLDKAIDGEPQPKEGE